MDEPEPNSDDWRTKHVRRGRDQDVDVGDAGTGQDTIATAGERDIDGLDRDLAAAERDVAAELRDREADAHDEAAGDLELSAGRRATGDRATAAAARARAASARAETATDRTQASSDRRVAADDRAQAADERDTAADLRDREAEAHDDAAVESDREMELRAAGDRQNAVAERARAALARAETATDRAQASSDREVAAGDRAQAARDREESGTDELTGVRRRGAGLIAIQREIDRARRNSEELVAAYVDVDGLKAENDIKGHAAGDALLISLADSMRACLRSYDVITRVGGDEFVCVLSHIAVDDAHRRFEAVSAKLAEVRPGSSITVGLASWQSGESADELIERADGALVRTRGRR